MMLICHKEDESRVISEANEDGILAHVIGETVASDTNEVSIISRFKNQDFLYSSKPQ